MKEIGNISQQEFKARVKGRAGRIYAARRGTVTIVEFEDETFMLNNLSSGAIVVNPVGYYWHRSIDFQCSWWIYYTYAMNVDFEQTERAGFITPLSATQREKVMERARIARETA